MAHPVHADRVCRLRWRSGSGDAGGPQRAWVESLLTQTELKPKSLPAAAILVVRELRRTYPGTGTGTGGGARGTTTPFRQWQQALSAQLEACLREAARPALGGVRAGSGAVWFADPSEVLLSLGRDAVRGWAKNRWWWKALFPGQTLEDAARRAWREWSVHVPAALSGWHRQDPTEAESFVDRGPQAWVNLMLEGLGKSYGIQDLDLTRTVAGKHRLGVSMEPRPEAGSPEASVPVRAPWEPWVRVSRSIANPEARLLLGLGVLLDRAPAVARSVRFAQRLSEWVGSVAGGMSSAEEPPGRGGGLEISGGPIQPQYAPDESGKGPNATIVGRPDSDTSLNPIVGNQGRSETTLVAESIDPGPPDDTPSIATAGDHPTSQPDVPALPPGPWLGPISAPAERGLPAVVPGPESCGELGEPAWPEERSEPMVDEASFGRAGVAGAGLEVSAIPPRAPGSTNVGSESEPDAALGTARSFWTDWGGALYLLNLATGLGLYGDFTQPANKGLGLAIWTLVERIAARWGGQAWTGDPLRACLVTMARGESTGEDDLAFVPPTEWRIPGDWLTPFLRSSGGSRQEDVGEQRTGLATEDGPGTRGSDDRRAGCGGGEWLWRSAAERFRIRHPAGFAVLDLAACSSNPKPDPARLLKECYAPLAAAWGPIRWKEDTDSECSQEPAFDRWLGWIAGYVSARVGLAMGLEPTAAMELLLRKRARLELSSARLDAFFALESHPIEIRLAGLDRDPGWIPSGGRAIYFHYD